MFFTIPNYLTLADWGKKNQLCSDNLTKSSNPTNTLKELYKFIKMH